MKLIVNTLICLVLLACAFRIDAACNTNPLDEVCGWKSIEDVNARLIEIYKQPESTDSELNNEYFALFLGVDSVHSLLTGERKNIGTKAASLESAIIKNKSIREIALIGVSIMLSQTTYFTDNNGRNILGGIYKNPIMVDDILKTRKRALEAFDLIVSASLAQRPKLGAGEK
jgi:hypothetical protein